MNEVKQIVFDSSSLISLSSSCLFNAMGKMFNELGLQGVISRAVELESVINPLKVKRLELSATRIKHGIDQGWITVVGLNKKEQLEANKLMLKANNCFYTSTGSIALFHRGEAEALLLTEKRRAIALAVDERTTRMFLEEPERLRRLIERRQERRIQKNQRLINELLERFKELKIVRSSELVALAFEKGFLEQEIGLGKKALEAALYSLKYQGCALSSTEIEEFVEARK